MTSPIENETTNPVLLLKSTISQPKDGYELELNPNPRRMISCPPAEEFLLSHGRKAEQQIKHLALLSETRKTCSAPAGLERRSKPAHRLKGTFSPGRLGGRGRRHCASDTSGGTRAEMEGKGTGPRSPEEATSKGNSRPRSQWQAGEPCLTGWVGGCRGWTTALGGRGGGGQGSSL